MYFVGPGDILMIFVLGILAEACTGPVVALYFAMLGDAADYGEWKYRRRATGLVYSAGTVAIKFGTGVAGALTGWVLNIFGYQANVAQSPEALTGIILLISVFPAVAALAAIVVFRFYILDEEFLTRIEKDLIERKGEVAA